MSDYVRVDIVPGPPAKLTLPGWDVNRVSLFFHECLECIREREINDVVDDGMEIGWLEFNIPFQMV